VTSAPFYEARPGNEPRKSAARPPKTQTAPRTEDVFHAGWSAPGPSVLLALVISDAYGGSKAKGDVVMVTIAEWRRSQEMSPPCLAIPTLDDLAQRAARRAALR